MYVYTYHIYIFLCIYIIYTYIGHQHKFFNFTNFLFFPPHLPTHRFFQQKNQNSEDFCSCSDSEDLERSTPSDAMISFEYLTGGFESETHPGAHELVHVTEMSKMPEVPDVFFVFFSRLDSEFFLGYGLVFG